MENGKTFAKQTKVSAFHMGMFTRLKRWLLFVVWVLWHINLCRLFNAKSIFIEIISSILNN